jgi:hypothetical protein
MITTKAVMDSLLNPAAGVASLAVLSRFRLDFHVCLAARADELADAVRVRRPARSDCSATSTGAARARRR